jgi:CO/xanthine dehydrogenase FAD-binding subunit
MMTAILIPPLPGSARGGFAKLGARRYLVISIAMCAAVIIPDEDGTVAEARVAIGACSPIAQRLPALEAVLAGAPLGEMPSRVTPEHLAPLSPIDDVRGTAGYRADAVLTMLRRLLSGLST